MTMTWRLAKSLITLRDQINALSPNRDKSWDGTIGDAEHASRSSDHNPYIIDHNGIGIVRALDITHDPAHGIDAAIIADILRRRHDPRIRYVISNRRIASATVDPWEWRKYTGTNPHDHHFHVSVVEDQRYDDDRPWDLSGLTVSGDERDRPEPEPSRPLLMRGTSGEDVKDLQRIINDVIVPGVKLLLIDGQFGPRTEEAVRAYQIYRGLVADGKVGRYTWAQLDAET